MNRSPYTTAFGAVLDQEIADAIRAGMSLDTIAAELITRCREVALAACVANHRTQEAKCYAV